MSRASWWLPWAVYGPLAALGAALSWLERGAVFTAPPSTRFASRPLWAHLWGLALAMLVVAATVHGTRLLVARAAWARRLHLRLRAALLGTSAGQLAVLSVCSAVAEELFFRAALVPAIGVVASSIVFGLLHVSGRDTYVGWMLWATLMGAVFAGLFLGSGSLLAPMLAHAAINYENMQYLCGHDPTLHDKVARAAQPEDVRRL